MSAMGMLMNHQSLVIGTKATDNLAFSGLHFALLCENDVRPCFDITEMRFQPVQTGLN